MKNTACRAFCFFLLLTFAVSAGEIRTWTSSGGKHKTEAEFIDLSEDGKTVTLKKADGKEIEVPLEKISQIDREYATKQKALTTQPKKVDRPDTSSTIPNTRQIQKPSHPSRRPRQDDFATKDLLRRKIDAVNRQDNGEVKVELSDKEKEGIVQYLLLAEKALGKKESEAGLSLLIGKLSKYKNGSGIGDYAYSDFSLIRLFGREVTNADVRYEKIDAYVAGLAGWVVMSDLSGSAAMSSNKAREESRRYGGKELARSAAGASAAASSFRSQKDIIESLLPECNRLSGNAHDKEEKERLGKKQREAEKKQLFGD